MSTQWQPVEEGLPEMYRVGLLHPHTKQPLVAVIDFITVQKAHPVYSAPTRVFSGVPMQVGEARLVGSVPQPPRTTARFMTEDGRATADGVWCRERGKTPGYWAWTEWTWNDNRSGMKNRQAAPAERAR